MTRNIMGSADKIPLVYEKISDNAADFDEAKTENHINAIRAISWWRAKYGNVIDEELMLSDTK